MCPLEGDNISEIFWKIFQPGQHWRIACVSHRSKYMAMAMKQVLWVLHNQGQMFADAGLLALQSSLERPGN